MRTLLTGAGGYIGLHIVRGLLEDGYDVTAVVRSPGRLGPFEGDPRLTVVETDLEHDSLAEALPGHDVCIHAALIWGEPGSELEGRDTALAASLFHDAGAAGLSRSIYISSVAVHRPFAGVMGEEDRLHPADVYGATKAAGETALRSACARHGMSGVVLRPGPVVGPPAFEGGSCRLPDRIAKIVQAAAAGQPIEVVRGEGRQLSDVSAVACAVRLLVEADTPQPTYVCVDRHVLTWERMARMVVRALDSSSEVRVLPPESQGPTPRFRTDLIEALLGGPANARQALHVQLRHHARALES